MADGGHEHEGLDFGAAELMYMTTPKQLIVGGMECNVSLLNPGSLLCSLRGYICCIISVAVNMHISHI